MRHENTPTAEDASNTDASLRMDGAEDYELLRRVIRFAVPHNAVLILVTPPGATLPLVPGYTVWSLRLLQGDSASSGLGADESIIATLTTLTAQGGAFLVIPRAVFVWLNQHQRVRQHLEQQYRLALSEENVCLIFALQEAPDREWRSQGAPDGLPLPPPELIALVTGMPQVEPFYWSGLLGARCIRGLLNKNGFTIERSRAILDFGCGCGRIMRHWQTLAGPQLFGVDYNPYLVQWCQTALPFASFVTNDLLPPLPHADAQFDLIYTISIFTHLEQQLQRAWIAELTRVLRPDGLLFLTVHGSTHIQRLSAEQKTQFNAGQLVVSQPELSGSNHCTTYHPEPYVKNVLAKDLQVIDFVPGGAKDANQDVFLLRKPITGR